MQCHKINSLTHAVRYKRLLPAGFAITIKLLAPGSDGFMAFTGGENKQVSGGYNLSGVLDDYRNAGNAVAG